MNIAYLLIGGNVGNREINLATARSQISLHCGEISKISSIYETAAWGNEDQPSFLNQAIELRTLITAKQLIRRILRIEKTMGRIREEKKYTPRIIDIDILLFNEERYNYAFLKVPHPEMHNRRFALMPLAEIASNVKHAIIGKTIGELLDECGDELDVRKISR